MIKNTRLYMNNNCMNPRELEFHIMGELIKDFSSNETIREMRNEIVRLTSDKISDYIIHNYLNDIISNIDIKAISNMVVAESGAKVNETLNKKLPDKILEIERITERVNTEVYEKNIFGGVKRVR